MEMGHREAAGYFIPFARGELHRGPGVVRTQGCSTVPPSGDAHAHQRCSTQHHHALSPYDTVKMAELWVAPDQHM